MQACPPNPFAPQAPLDGPVIAVFQGDAVVLPLTWWQAQPSAGAAGVPVDMTGMVPSAEFLSAGQSFGQGVAVAVTDFDPPAGRFTVTAPGRGQAGDLTSGLPAGPARLGGPRIRVHYDDAAGNPHTFGTFYLLVK